MHVLMRIECAGSLGIYVILLQVKGILTLFYVKVRDIFCPFKDGIIRSLILTIPQFFTPMVFGIFQPVFNDLLVCGARGTYVEIVIIAFIARIVTGYHGRLSLALLLQDPGRKMKGTHQYVRMFSRGMDQKGIFQDRVGNGHGGIHEGPLQDLLKGFQRMV